MVRENFVSVAMAMLTRTPGKRMTILGHANRETLRRCSVRNMYAFQGHNPCGIPGAFLCAVPQPTVRALTKTVERTFDADNK